MKRPRYTRDELMKLVDVLQDEGLLGLRNVAFFWNHWRSGTRRYAKKQYGAFYDVMTCPDTDLPPLINHPHASIRCTVKWRLSIGK